MAALQNDWAGLREGSPLPLFDAAEVTPPGLCSICAGVGIVTGPNGRATNCSCVALPPDPNAPEDHEKKWKGPLVETMQEVFAAIGSGGVAGEKTDALPAAAPGSVQESPEVLREFLAKNRPGKK